MNRQPRVIIFTFGYPPAYLSGGPVRSISALVSELGPDFDFVVVTSSTDLDGKQLASRPSNELGAISREIVIRLPPRRLTVRKIRNLCREFQPDLVYLNSFFSFRFAILVLMTVRLAFPSCRVLIAPRGEFNAGAMSIHQRRKTAYIQVFRCLGLRSRTHWHASTFVELDEIKSVLAGKRNISVHVAMNLSPIGSAGAPSFVKPSSPLRLVFYSRIVPKKNLQAAIRSLCHVSRPTSLSIAGPIEDVKYWENCRQAISEVDPNTHQISYLGPVEATDALKFLSQFDLLVLPTLGENFGHVILESLSVGVPVLIGRDTPWSRASDETAVMTCNETDPRAIGARINAFINLSSEDQLAAKRAALTTAERFLTEAKKTHVASYRTMFRDAISL